MEVMGAKCHPYALPCMLASILREKKRRSTHLDGSWKLVPAFTKTLSLGMMINMTLDNQPKTKAFFGM